MSFAALQLLKQSHTILYSPTQGALTQLWAGTSPEGANLNGKVRFHQLYLILPSESSAS